MAHPSWVFRRRAVRGFASPERGRGGARCGAGTYDGLREPAEVLLQELHHGLLSPFLLSYSSTLISSLLLCHHGGGRGVVCTICGSMVVLRAVRGHHSGMGSAEAVESEVLS